MHIDIHIPRPGTTLLALAAISGWGMILTGTGAMTASLPTFTNPTAAVGTSASSSAPAVATHTMSGEDLPHDLPIGGPFDEVHDEDILDERMAASSSSRKPPMDPTVAAALAEAESRALEARAAQQLLREREEVIRYQLDVLKVQREKLGNVIDEDLEEEFCRSTRLLLTLLQDQRKAEQFLLSSLHQIWESDGRGMTLGAQELQEGTNIVLTWPVDPLEGVSATFLDAGYEKRFKFKHFGVDVPTLQGTTVHAAASGIVKDVIDHGLGFSYITIEHPGGYATLYGHMSKFSVKPGQFVAAGDAIGLSGGMPGTPGAGFSTGPHVHFGLYVGGKAVDPTSYLPSLE